MTKIVEKNTEDMLCKLIIEDTVGVTAVDTTKLVEYARSIHGTYPVCTAALGRTLTAAILMASGLKHENCSITISINGGGMAGTIMATANESLGVKGCIGNPCVDLSPTPFGKLDVGGAVGRDGFVTVARDMGTSQPYVGRTELVSGEIAEDLALYYLKSEQQPSAIYLSVRLNADESVMCAGGLFVAPTPGTPQYVIDEIESRAIADYGVLLLSHSPESAVNELFSGMEIRTLAHAKPSYNCDCTRERLERVIISLGREEIDDIISKDGHAELVCRFCNKKYDFSEAELQRLLAEAE